MSILKVFISTSAGIVAGRIIFGLSQEYCGAGFFTGVGTAALSIGAFGLGFTSTQAVFDAVGKTIDKKEESKDGRG